MGGAGEGAPSDIRVAIAVREDLGRCQQFAVPALESCPVSDPKPAPKNPPTVAEYPVQLPSKEIPHFPPPKASKVEACLCNYTTSCISGVSTHFIFTLSCYLCGRSFPV